ncbi:Uncharacterised protein [Klebsiella pneumoniae]|nr:Uncharacterised protein [Klebsiella pneumoniae]
MIITITIIATCLFDNTIQNASFDINTGLFKTLNTNIDLFSGI